MSQRLAVCLKRLVFLMLWVVISVTAFARPADAEERVALVIGNAAYENTSPLRNPRNDAEGVAAALERLGFKVITGFDTDRMTFAQKAAAFAKAARGADAAVFYYAGHGLQVDGKNYLVPVDAKLGDEVELDFQTVELSTILRILDRAKQTKIAILDACRDNPLARSLSRSMGTRSSAVGRGLARVDSGSGTLIAFATRPGAVALDGRGGNSPFTAALLAHIETPGLDIGLMMRRVRRDVIARTNGGQVPWSSSSLTRDFTLAPGTEGGRSEAQAPMPSQSPRSEAAQAWALIKDTDNERMLEVFIRRHPDSVYAEFAKIRLEELLQHAEVDDSILLYDRFQLEQDAARGFEQVDLRFALQNVDSDAIALSVNGERISMQVKGGKQIIHKGVTCELILLDTNPTVQAAQLSLACK
jgi:uncharacterized caspase-like protein